MCGHDPSSLTPAQPYLLCRFGTVDRVAAVGHAGDAPEFEPRRVSGQLVDNTVGESNTSAKTKSELEAKAKKEKANKKQMDTQKRKDVKDAKDAKATARKNKAAVKKRERDAASPGVASADQHEIWLQGKLMTSCEKLIDAASDLTEHKKQGRQAREPSLRATIETLFLRPGKIGRINCKNCLPADLWKDSDGYVVYFLVVFIVGHCCELLTTMRATQVQTQIPVALFDGQATRPGRDYGRDVHNFVCP